MQPLLKTHDRHSTPRPHFRTELPSVQLEITRGRARDKIRHVEGRTFFIGSGSDCDLVLGDDHFPELHSYLLLTSQAVVIRHLGQQPTMFVDGRPHSRAVLTDQARIQIGPYEFTMHIAARPTTEATLPVNAYRIESHSTPLPSPSPSPPAVKNDVLQSIENFFDSLPPNRMQVLAQLKLLGAVRSATDWQDTATPVSVGLVAPSVKPPPWQHISTLRSACQ